MINLSAESFPDDSIIHNISGVTPQNAPPPPRIMLNGAQRARIDEHHHQALQTTISSQKPNIPSAETQQLQQLLTPFVTIDLARGSVSPESAASDDSILQHISGEFPQNATTTPQPLVIIVDDGARPPQETATREPDESHHQQQLLTPFDTIDHQQTRRTSVSPADSATSSTSSLRSNTKTYTKSAKASAGIGATRRIGAAYGRHHNPMLSTKSASVDGLHRRESSSLMPNDDEDVDRTSQSSLGSAKAGATARRTRYDHVQSKVKMFIDSQREQDNRRRSAKLERHRSMPESLCTQNTLDSVPQLAAAVATPNAAELAALHAALLQRDQLLAEKELVIRNINTCYETSNLRDTDERLKLERKVDLLRWELQKANDERRNCEQELGKLKRFQLQQQASSATVSPSLTAGFEGLHHRNIVPRHDNISSSSATSGSIMRPIIEHSRKSDYRLLSAVVSDVPSSSDDEDDEIGRPIITSSSASHDVLMHHKADDRSPISLRNDADASSAHGNSAFGRHQSSSSAGSGRKRGHERRKVRTMRKRLRRMLRRCVPCLDKSQESEEIEADISLLYAGFDDVQVVPEEEEAIGAGGESTRTTTTGYSSF